MIGANIDMRGGPYPKWNVGNAKRSLGPQLASAQFPPNSRNWILRDASRPRNPAGRSAWTSVPKRSISHDAGAVPSQDYNTALNTPDDNLLIRTWNDGAYTVQTNIASQDTCRFPPQVQPDWAYNASLGVATPFLLGGTKRDPTVWRRGSGVQGSNSALGRRG
ncbi:uncharacterized protein BDR25DRAFT_340650 [Lindgomyces ingoldianus]|uniref:Uncharacterized protein n=1 Tax=Lindgomyces ingoldianus TaxID=673940 RepID=A0ACB6R725_9PLEO|nr:uncharacterized protein BDR25DRAFT_340650 [Lindgomyces ingoldianus]KAF2475064.1 hypothetical protein BDR25DRAFT_340650 [Lindgomyces ingoldianus]